MIKGFIMQVSPIVFETVCRLRGWPGAAGQSLDAVEHLVSMYGGDGDHLEIGSLFGASAIVAARTKLSKHQNGKVVCIDPMLTDEQEPYFHVEGMTPVEKLFFDNQELIFRESTKPFSNIEFVRARSQPWPLDPSKRFTTAFIDGWHYEDGPLMDAKIVAKITDVAILLDDVGPHYPDVYKAFKYLVGHPKWYPISMANYSAIFLKVNNGVKFTTNGKEQY